MQNQNDPNERFGFQMRGLAATPVGSAFDGVLAFASDPVATGQYAVAAWATVVRSATNGTSVQILKRGIYVFNFGLQCGAANTMQGGISLDELVATLGSNPTPSTVGAAIRAFGRWNGQAAGDLGSISLSAVIPVTQAMINAGQGIVRPRATNGADATPVAAGLALADCYFDCERIADLPGN